MINEQSNQKLVKHKSQANQTNSDKGNKSAEETNEQTIKNKVNLRCKLNEPTAHLKVQTTNDVENETNLGCYIEKAILEENNDVKAVEKIVCGKITEPIYMDRPKEDTDNDDKSEAKDLDTKQTDGNFHQSVWYLNL